MSKATKKGAPPQKGSPSKQDVKHKSSDSKLIPNDPKMRDAVRLLSKRAGELMAERKNLLLSQSDFDKKYVAVDVKGLAANPFTDKLKLNQLQLDSVRATVRDLWGDRDFKVKLWEKITHNTGGTGNITAVTSIDPSTLTEFTSLSAIFDEYRVVGGQFEFTVACYVINTSNVGTFLVVAYDPSDSAALATVQEGLQLQQHKLCPIGILVTSVIDPFNNFMVQRLNFRVPEGILQMPTPTTASMTAGWQACDSVTGFMPYGSLKSCAVATSVVSGLGVGGMMAYHVEFRSRK